MNRITTHQLHGSQMIPLNATGAAGSPTRRFLKDLIRVGDYTHPTRGWHLQVTSDRLRKWEARFKAARAAGVDLEVTVDHSQKAQDIVGYLTDVYVEGTRLMGVHEFSDDQSAQLAARCKNVSVEIDPDFIDGKGNHYGEMIVKSSLVQSPIVPGQTPFERLAASHGDPDNEPHHLWLAAELTTRNHLMNAQLLLALSTILGREIKAEDDHAALANDLTAAWNTKQSDAPDEAKKLAKEPASPEAESLRRQVRELARASTITGVKSLAGKIPAALLPRLEHVLAGSDALPSALCMSHAGDASPPPASAVIAVLSELPDLAELKQFSRNQTSEVATNDPFEKLVRDSIARTGAAI